MKNYLLPIAIFGTIAQISYISPAVALSPVEIKRIATQTTVQITGCGFGSGVIIRKDGNTYTVMTVDHAVKNTGCQVTTPDETKYQVAQIKRFPNSVDLAVFTFTSNKNYPVAKLIDNSDRVEALETIYVSGFPLSTAIKSSIFTIVKGDLVANPPTKQQGKGYSLIYSNHTLPGHSGGPVWNDKGEVIAIHGQGDVEAKSQATINEDVRVKTGYNLGITVNTFTKLAAAAGVSGYTPVVVAAKPKPVDDLIASSVLKESKGDYLGIFADLEQAILLQKGSANPLDSQNARLYFGRGVAKSSLGDKKGAIDDLNRAIALDPNHADAYNNRGAVKSDLGDHQGAIDDYNRAISLNPNDADAYNNRGVDKSSLGDKKGAIDDYNRAIVLNPNLAQAYNNRGNAKSDLGDKKGAIDDYNRAIVLNPNFAQAYNNRGINKSSLGDKKGAIDDYNRAIALNPNYANAYYSRGNVYSSLGERKWAIDDYNRAIALNPNHAKAYNNRGFAKFNLGDDKGAIDDYNRAITLNPNYAGFYYSRGNVKSSLGDKKGAIQDLKQAAELFRLQGQTDNYQRAIRIIKQLMP